MATTVVTYHPVSRREWVNLIVITVRAKLTDSATFPTVNDAKGKFAKTFSFGSNRNYFPQ